MGQTSAVCVPQFSHLPAPPIYRIVLPAKGGDQVTRDQALLFMR